MSQEEKEKGLLVHGIKDFWLDTTLVKIILKIYNNENDRWFIVN